MRMASTHLGFTSQDNLKSKGRGVIPRMAGSAKVSPSPLASHKTRTDMPRESIEEALVEPEEPVTAEGDSVSWEELPGPVLELIFNHLKRAAIAGEHVFLKSPDQQRRVTAVGMRLGAVCRAWQAESRFLFFKDCWQSHNSIIHPRQCFSLAPTPKGLFQCAFLVVEDMPSMHCHYFLHQGTESGKLLMTAEFDKEGNIGLFQHGKKWQECAGECAVVKVGRCNTHYVLEPSFGRRACLGDVRYVDRIKACLSPRKMRVTLPGDQALNQFDPSSTTIDVPVTEEKEELTTAVAPGGGLRGLLTNFGAVHTKKPCKSGVTGQPKAQERTLVNREPEFKPEFRGWCLNFKGRVQDPSVKNFQLVDEADTSELVMQFGRMKGHSYILDFQPHIISAAQAFAVALSNFHR